MLNAVMLNVVAPIVIRNKRKKFYNTSPWSEIENLGREAIKVSINTKSGNFLDNASLSLVWNETKKKKLLKQIRSTLLSYLWPVL